MRPCVIVIGRNILRPYVIVIGRNILRPYTILRSIQTPILDRFGDVLGTDGNIRRDVACNVPTCMIQIRDGAGDLEDFVMGPGGQADFLNRAAEQIFPAGR